MHGLNPPLTGRRFDSLTAKHELKSELIDFIQHLGGTCL